MVMSMLARLCNLDLRSLPQVLSVARLSFRRVWSRGSFALGCQRWFNGWECDWHVDLDFLGMVMLD